MTQYRWKVFAPLAALCLLIVALPAATSTVTTTITAAARSANRTAAFNPAPHRAPAAQPATVPGSQFVPGLPLLDPKGASTGAAEPSIRLDREGHVYVSGPAGVPTGGCPLWRVHPDFQNAKGLPYEYLGKFDTDQNSVGGGDCDIATGGMTITPSLGFDNLALSSLSLANLTTNQSSDGGATFRTKVANPFANQTPLDDRQWNAADSGLGQVYLTVHDVAMDNIQIASSTDGGFSYVSNMPAIQTTPGSCGIVTGCLSAATMNNHFGNIVVNPVTHKLYTIYVAPRDLNENQVAGAAEHVVYVAVGDPCTVTCAPGQPLGPISWTDHVVYNDPITTTNLAHIFPVIAIDKAGTIYTEWSDTHHVFMSHSSQPEVDNTWSAPVQVDQVSSHSTMFPWMVGGAVGALDLVWYSAQQDLNQCGSGATDDSQGVNNNCHNVWTVQFAQSFDANTAHPNFTQSTASATMHRGSLCDQGLNCNTSMPPGDRTLADFFQVDLDPAGAANIAYASDASTPGSPMITYTRQCTGPSATTGGTINYPCGSLLSPPPPPPGDSCSGQNVVADPTGDATNPLGLPGPTDQVDITSLSFSNDPAQKTLTTGIRVSNLSQTPIAGTADTYYYAVWTYPGTGKTYATLASEPDPSGIFAYSYGEFDPATNQLISNTVQTASGSFTPGANGVISVTVPLTGVGNPTIPTTDPNATPPAVVNPFALTISGEGALGTGLIFTHPDDRAPNSGFGARYAVCPAGSGSPVAGSPTAGSPTAGSPTAGSTTVGLPTVAGSPTAGSPTAVATMSTPPAATSTMGPVSGGTVGFGNTTVVEDQREGAEPDVKVCGPGATWSYANCGLDNPYVSWPYGFSTTSSFISRSEDQGRTFKLVPSNTLTGKPNACPGGGDTDLALSPGLTQTQDYLNFVDLQGLTNFSSAVSTDGGQTSSSVCNPTTANAAPVDRQWFGVYGNQAAAAALPPTPQVVPGVVPGTIISPSIYLDYDIVGAPTCTITGTLPGSETSAGNEFVVQRSTDGGRTFAPFSIADCNDGIAGNMQVNQTNGHVFAIHTAYANPAAANTTNVVTVNRSTDGGSTWTKTVAFTPTVPACNPGCVVGEDFAVLAIDKSGGLYAVWAQNTTDMTGTTTGPGHIFYSYSANEGATWTPEQQVDANGTTDVNLFAWVAAGDPGKIDVVWYGTNKAAGVNTFDSGSQTTDWFPYLSQSFNANGTGATFSTPARVSQHPNHNGGICTMGIGCTTGGDRSLADFFQVDVNKAGGADVIFADTSNNSNTSQSGNQSALVDEARQISGPTLFGPTLSGTATTCTAVTGTPCQADTTGDATYEANGLIGANVPKLDITGSSLNISPTDAMSLDVRMNIADLTNGLPSATDTAINANDTVVDYLTSWNYHVPGNGQAQFDSTGNIYYAYLEVNRASGTVTAYDGNTCGIATTKDKYLVYPGQNAINSHVDQTAGTIDLYVPRADVGNPPDGASLYSVTAHTVGQPLAAGPSTTCLSRDANGNASDPGGQIFDVYDKSPAYTSILASGTAATPGPSVTVTLPTVGLPSATSTRVLPAPTATATNTQASTAPTAINTQASTTPTATATNTRVSTPPTAANTQAPPAPTATNTPMAPASTATNTPSPTTTTPGVGATAMAASPTGTTAPASGATNTPSSGNGSGAGPVATSTTAAEDTATAVAIRTAAAEDTATVQAGGTAVSPGLPNSMSQYHPRITLAPTSAHAGDLITVLGSGFASGEQVTLALDGEGLDAAPAVITTARGGTFTATFRAPSGLLQGANTVSAVGTTSQRAAVATLTGLGGFPAQAYFAGGLETGGAHSFLAVLNPSGQQAHVRLTFYSQTSDRDSMGVTVPAHTQMVMPVARLTQLRGTFGLALTADQRVASQLNITRAGRDGDVLLGAPGLARTWNLAEGYTGLTFHETVSVLNPDGQHAAQVRLRVLPFGGHRGRTVTVTVRPHTNAVVDTNRILPHLSVSVLAEASRPVVVERTLTFSRDGHGSDYGLTARIGTTTTSRVWLFAEGTTVNSFETYLTILNPNARAARVTARFYDRNGRLLRDASIRVAGLSRANIRLNGLLRASGVASVVTSDQPVVVERPEYFGSPNGTRIAGSDVFGRNGAGTRWSFAGGDTRPGQSEFLLLYNPAAVTVRVRAMLYGTNGRTVQEDIALGPNVRATVDVGRAFQGARGLHGVTLVSSNGYGFIAEQTGFASNRTTLQSTQGLAQ